MSEMTHQTAAVTASSDHRKQPEKLHPVADAKASEVAAAQQQAMQTTPQKQHNTGIYRFFPDWLINHSSTIMNAGLFTGTGVMLHSVYRGGQISKDIYDAQIDLIKKKPGITPERTKLLIDAAVKNRVMIAPGLHKMRFFYLTTAMLGFAVGALFKRKEETPEEQEKYQKMGLVEYMRTRAQQVLDPVNHSRQSSGLIAGFSGILAILSALSQPGGVHKSELYVGTTLATGGALLAFINNPQTAQNAFSTLWMSRLPAVLTGTKESMWTKPAFKNPHVLEMKKEPAYFERMKDVHANGIDEKIWLGLRKVRRTGDDAVRVLGKQYGGETLSYDRKDIAYPTGQWTNMIAAAIGFLGKGASKAKDLQHQQAQPAPQEKIIQSPPPAAPVEIVSAKPVQSANDAVFDEQVQANSVSPAAQVQAPPAELTRLEAANDKEYGAAKAAVA